LPEYQALGARLVGILGQAAAGVRKFAETNVLSFPLLVDPDRSVIKAYGVYNLLWFDAFNIARPSVFLLDPSGIVRHMFVGESQTDRPTQDAVLGALRQIAGGEKASSGTG
jgi:peroxiredoxin